MSKIELISSSLSKSYSGRIIFKNLSFTLSGNSSLAVTGRNGSGKSTLLKVLSGLLRQSSGEVSINSGGKALEKENYYKTIGMTAPYLNLYDELTGYENLDFFYSLKNASTGSHVKESDRINALLERVGLGQAKNKLLKNYSSGMKQRLKLAFAVINDPGILIIDEPRTNLDAEGIRVVYEIAEEQKAKGILIIATNEAEDLKLCGESINIEEYQ
jgi:heme exporter protein A